MYTADTTIIMQKDTAGGIHAAGGGTLYAWDMNVEINGESSAAIRSDRGGGKMVVDGGSLTAKNGGMFYTTNTESTITLSDVDITNAEDSEFS